MDAGGPSPTSATTAAGTSTPRLKFKRLKATLRKPPYEAVVPTIRQDVAVLKASGMTTRSIAKTLRRDPATVKRVQKLPEVQQMIGDLRKMWKQVAQTQVTALAGDTWQMVEEFVTSRDSKQFDNAMRGVAAMEKVSASVSGEGTKLEVSGILPQAPQIELKVLIHRLFGTPHES